MLFRDLKIPSNPNGILAILEHGNPLKPIEIRCKGNPLNPLVTDGKSVATDVEIRWNGWKSVGTDGNPLERMEIRCNGWASVAKGFSIRYQRI